MAVRFQCSSCAQPIEIDDEWAQKAVACPYCRKTITAPMESTIGPDDEIPVAAPLRPTTEPPHASFPGVPSRVAPDGNRGVASMLRRGGNPIAVVALALAGAAMACFVIVVAISGAHAEALSALYENAKQTQGTQEQFRVMMEFIEAQGGKPPAWMMGLALAQIGCVVLSLAALTCGILGLRSRTKRTSAAVALVISGGFLLLMCAGLVSGG